MFDVRGGALSRSDYHFRVVALRAVIDPSLPEVHVAVDLGFRLVGEPVLRVEGISPDPGRAAAVRDLIEDWFDRHRRVVVRTRAPATTPARWWWGDFYETDRGEHLAAAIAAAGLGR